MWVPSSQVAILATVTKGVKFCEEGNDEGSGVIIPQFVEE